MCLAVLQELSTIWRAATAKQVAGITKEITKETVDDIMGLQMYDAVVSVHNSAKSNAGENFRNMCREVFKIANIYCEIEYPIKNGLKKAIKVDLYPVDQDGIFDSYLKPKLQCRISCKTKPRDKHCGLHDVFIYNESPSSDGWSLENRQKEDAILIIIDNVERQKEQQKAEADGLSIKIHDMDSGIAEVIRRFF